jgi:signal transduction histidine kinase
MMIDTSGDKPAYHSSPVHSEELGRLLSLITHEVRAPLGVMRGYMRMLEQRRDITEQQRQPITAALKASDRATDILNELSTLAKLHRGEATFAQHAVALESLLRSAVHRVDLPASPIVTVHVGEVPGVAVTADEELMPIAIASLTSAVVRAQAADGRVFLTGREHTREDASGVAVDISAGERLTPADDGRPLDLLRGGLGLRLPIALFIVAAHRGTITEYRAGNRFVGVTVWLPLATM